MTHRFLAAVNIAIVIGLLSACTELEVRRMPQGIVEGIPYSLPKKSFLISFEYDLKNCSVAIDEEKKPLFTLVVGKTITVVPATEVDEHEHFYIPYSTLRNWFKDTDITIESYENQTLKTVSATVTDKTGETISAAIGTALRLASIVGGVTLYDAAPEKMPSVDRLREEYCGQSALNALAKIKALQDKAETAGPAKAADKAAAGAITGKPAAAADVAAQIAQLKSEYLTHKEVLHWTPVKPSFDSAVSISKTTVSTESYPRAFLDQKTWITPAGLNALKNAGDADDKNRIKKLITYISLEVSEPMQKDPNPDDLPNGFVLRNASNGLLRVCESLCPTGQSGDVSNVLSANEYFVPQLGQYIVLPLKNRLFENQTLTIGLSPDGAITKLGLKSNASAPAALGSINSDLEAINKAKVAEETARANARTSALNNAKDHANQVKAENSAVADCLAAQKTVRDAGGAVTGTCQ